MSGGHSEFLSHIRGCTNGSVASRDSYRGAPDREIGSSGNDAYRRQPIRSGGSSEGSLSIRYRGMGEPQLEGLSLQWLQGLRHHEEGRLHV
jgi:hypothetical protein